MKTLLATVLIAARARIGAGPGIAPAKPAAAPAAKPTRPSRPSQAGPVGAARPWRRTRRSTTIPTIKLSDADLEMARKVYVGDIPCELGASVKITPMKREGIFMVTTKGHRFRMHPVESRTGAIRLEDPKRGAMWLQLGNKSMLMSQKLGQRLADECQSPAAADLCRRP